MTYLLYNILIHLALIVSVPYYLFKSIFAGKYRHGAAERFGFIDRIKLKALGSGPVVWVHAVSVGETKAAAQVLRLIRKSRPDVKIVFSTVTKTGNMTAETDCKGLIDCLIYFPLDLPSIVARAAAMIRPSLVIIIEKEFWPNFLRRMRATNVPVVVINGAMSDRSYKRFARFGFFFKDVFNSISYFAARTATDRDKAIGVGVRAEVCENIGNIKFDMKPPALDNAGIDRLARALGIPKEGPRGGLIVAGSTHAGEEEIIIDAFRRLSSEDSALRLVIAPRHPERFADVEAILKKSGLKYALRSRSDNSAPSASIVMLDTVGELMSVYSFANVAIVCGSLVGGIGGHNLLEPAMLGVPVVYGRNVSSYEEMASLLEDSGAGFRVNDEAGLCNILKRLLTSPEAARTAGAKGLKVIAENQGASKRAVEIIEGFLKTTANKR